MCRFAIARATSSQQTRPSAGNSSSAQSSEAFKSFPTSGGDQFSSYGPSSVSGGSECQLASIGPDSCLGFNFPMDFGDLMEPSDFLELMQDSDFFLPPLEQTRNKPCTMMDLTTSKSVQAENPANVAPIALSAQNLPANVYNAPSKGVFCASEANALKETSENTPGLLDGNFLTRTEVVLDSSRDDMCDHLALSGDATVGNLGGVLKQEPQHQSSELSKEILYALHLDSKRKAIQTEEDLNEAFERIKRRRRESSQRSRAKRTDYIKTLELENALLREEVLKLKAYMSRSPVLPGHMAVRAPCREQGDDWNMASAALAHGFEGFGIL